MHGQAWSDEECALLWRERKEKRPATQYKVLAERLGRNLRSVMEKMRHLERIQREPPKFIRAPSIVIATPRDREADRRMLDERDIRLAALEQRDLTAVLLGDPPPGFSALDGRVGQCLTRS